MLAQPPMDDTETTELVSTGHLPPPGQVQKHVDAAYRRFKSNDAGENSHVYPALAHMPRDLFGICVAGTAGALYAVGDTDCEFTIMSVAKPFVFALVCQTIGAEQVRAKVGVKGQLVSKFLSNRLGLNLFASRPAKGE